MYERKKTKLIQGVGINDADYRVGLRSNGVLTWKCPIYVIWGSMLSRCYSPKYHKENPTYLDCYVSPAWLRFSEFRKWVVTQNWEGLVLDKDTLTLGNKVYSEDQCVFIGAALNSFLTNRKAARGPYPLGVGMWKGRYFAYCNNPFTLRMDHLGRFSSAELAHEAWRQRKHQHACTYADMQTDQRIADALRNRYSIYRENY